MKTWMLAAGLLVLVACQDAPPPETQTDVEPAAEVMAGEFEGTQYGEPLTLTTLTSVSVVAARPDDFVGQTLMMEGVVTEVCDRAGCWMMLAAEDGETTFQIKVDDGVIIFPQEAVGQRARVEGVVEKIERTEEERRERAANYAEMDGVEFDPESIVGPETTYRLKATGAIIAE
jgi:hypothetical protein